MTDQTGGESRAVANRPERQYQQVQNVQPMLDTSRFEHFQRAAQALMHSSILNPSIRGSSPQQCFSNLMLVFDLSDRWKLPAMSIAQGIAIVHDKVVYEGKLITAMLDASMGVRLHYWYQGQRGKDDYRIYVSDSPWDDLTDEQLADLKPGAQIRGRRLVDGSVAEWRTFQKDGRTPNPAWTGAATQNQLSYRGAREWARRFEPAQMLGVYGDDEIDAMTIRMEARDITPVAPGLSAGFARAQPDLRSMADLEQVDQVTGEVTATAEQAAEAAKGSLEGGLQAQVDDTATAEAEAATPAPAKRTAKQQKVVDDRAKALEKAQAIGQGARDAAAWGYDGELLDLMGGQEKWDKLTAEEQGYASNGWAEGRGALEDELESAFNAGQMGVAQLPTPDWLTDGDKSAQRRWSLITDEHKRGLAEREAERAQDQAQGDDAVEQDTGTGDDALDAIAQAEPDLVETTLQDQADDADDAAFDDVAQADPLDEWIASLEALQDWISIKAALTAVIKTPAWAQASGERQSDVRRAAWVREAVLIEGGHDRMDFITDLTAFRCWIETTSDLDAINGNWQTLVRQPIYTSLKPEQAASMQAAVLKRVEQIQEALRSGKS